jgi:phage baseplate assembly protein W
MALYRGLSYPLEVKDGKLVAVEDFSIIEQNMISVLETRPFERVMRSSYGFDPKIFDTLEPNAINARINKAISENVPNATDVVVLGNVSTVEEGMYQVTIKYRVNGKAAPSLDLTLKM